MRKWLFGRQSAAETLSLFDFMLTLLQGGVFGCLYGCVSKITAADDLGHHLGL